MPSNQINYINKYNKNNYKMYQFRVKKTELDLINKLDSISNRNSYITNLILEDLNPSILSLKEIKERIKPVIEKYQIEEVYLFGSYARGEANRNSDIDIYCSSGNVKGLFERATMIQDFKDALHKDVDLVIIGSKMNPLFKQEIEKDMIKIF